MTFGIPNGDFSGVRDDDMEDPSHDDDDPFDAGVEHGGKEEPLTFTLTYGPFTVDSDGESESEDEDYEEFKSTVDYEPGDPGYVSEPEEPRSLDDLDNETVVAGDHEINYDIMEVDGGMEVGGGSIH